MARGSRGRNRRPRQHARRPDRGQLTPEEAIGLEGLDGTPVEQSGQPTVEPGAPPRSSAAKPAPKPRPAKPERSGQRKPEKRRDIEDTLFFTRLRKRAKWVFAALAAAFAVGFLAFGIGTGGGGIGDVLRDFFGGDGTTSLSEARDKAEENPDDVQAQLDYAAALRGEQQEDGAVSVYESVLALEPQNEDALTQLAALYGRQGQLKQQEAQFALFEAQQSAPANPIQPVGDTGFAESLAENPFVDAASQRALEEATRIQDESAAIFAKQQAIYVQLVALDPEDPLRQLQLGQAAQFAGDDAAALAAYEAALALDPEGGQAPLIENQIRLLGGTVPGDEAATTDEATATDASATTAETATTADTSASDTVATSGDETTPATTP